MQFLSSPRSASSTRPSAAVGVAKMLPMLCLANSFKPGGRCVAGVEWADGRSGNWLRPMDVSHESGSLSARVMSDGSGLFPGDIVTVPVAGRSPHAHQQENVDLQVGQDWLRLGRVTWEVLLGLAESAGNGLWESGWHNANDRVPVDKAFPAAGSLRFVRVNEVVVSYSWHDARRPKAKAWFRHQGTAYCLSVTDPAILLGASSAGAATVVFHDALLCVSLGREFNGYCYKLMATLLTRSQFEGRAS